MTECFQYSFERIYGSRTGEGGTLNIKRVKMQYVNRNCKKKETSILKFVRYGLCDVSIIYYITEKKPKL